MKGIEDKNSDSQEGTFEEGKVIIPKPVMSY